MLHSIRFFVFALDAVLTSSVRVKLLAKQGGERVLMECSNALVDPWWPTGVKS